jgi:hypothetical protein
MNTYRCKVPGCEHEVEYVKTEWACCEGNGKDDEHYQVVYCYRGKLYRCTGATFARDYERAER